MSSSVAPRAVDNHGLDQVQQAFACAKNSPFYARKFGTFGLESWEDFHSLPTTTKEELRRAAPNDTLAVPKEDVWHYHESFGTTGKPLCTWFTRDDFEREVELIGRWTAPIKPGDRVLNRLPYAFAVPPFALELKTRRDGGIIIPASNLTWNVSYVRTLDLIHRLQADVITSLPFEPVLLDLLAPRCGYDLRKDLGSVRHLMLAGGLVTPPLKQFIEKRWDASVGLVYGLTETGGIASMCDAWRLHVHPNAFVLEVVDPQTGSPVPNGDVGLLLVTSHYRQAAPLFRYESRDYCRRHADSCPCGDPSPTIEILGRIDDTLEVGGRSIYYAHLDQAIRELAAELDSAIYFVIATRSRLHIRIEAHNGKQALDPQGVKRLQEKLDAPTKVTVCPSGEILNYDSMLAFPSVGKPHPVSDWRKDPRRCVNLSEALVEWPKMPPRTLLDFVWRFFKAAWLRLTVR